MMLERMDLRRPVLLVVALLAALAMLTVAAAAQDLKTFTKKGSFEDVKLDLSDAITKRGLVVDFTGHVSRMLERTGKDVGSTKQVYRNAEYVVFCSAQLSRQMMEADAANAGYCPFVMFIYESAAKAGEVVVGYRPMPKSNSAASQKAFSEIDALLDGIAREAVK